MISLIFINPKVEISFRLFFFCEKLDLLNIEIIYIFWKIFNINSVSLYSTLYTKFSLFI